LPVKDNEQREGKEKHKWDGGKEADSVASKYSEEADPFMRSVGNMKRKEVNRK